MGINKPVGKKLQNMKFKVKVTKNGPYIFFGRIPLTTQIIVLDADGQCLAWRETKRYPERQTYSLCSCERSKNLPFCDSSHIETNFDGSETASRQLYLDQCEKFTGPTLDLTDAKALCADGGFCERAGGTWNLISRSDDPQARRIAFEEGCNCPSGRLVVWDKASKVIEPVLESSIGLTDSPGGGFKGPI